MANEDIKMLRKAILDYFKWLDSGGQYRGNPSYIRYSQILMDFLFFAIDHDLSWQQMFTPQTLAAFQSFSGFKGASRALITFSGYLFIQGKIDQPLKIPKPKPPLPEIYEQYLLYQKQSLQVCRDYSKQTRKILLLFHEHLEKHRRFADADRTGDQRSTAGAGDGTIEIAVGEVVDNAARRAHQEGAGGKNQQ